MAQEQSTATSTPPRTNRPSRLFGRYIIKNNFQFKFTLIIFVFLAIAAATIWFEGHLAVKQMIKNGVISNQEAISSLKVLNNLVAQTAMIGLAVVFGLSLFFSHFIAGPIYRFERTFQEVEKGDITPIVRLRPHDEFKDTAEYFNRALAGLRRRYRTEREALAASVDKLKKLSDAMKQAGHTNEATQLDQIIFDLQNKPAQLKFEK